jgi:alanine transaminase
LAGVSLLLSMLITPSKSGILIPIPQYPLYSATIARYAGIAVPYYLDEASDWSTSIFEIESAIERAQKDGVEVTALVIINPGNPTGALLDEATQEMLVHFCQKYSLVLLADEVYQTNLHSPSTYPFTSFKKVVSKLRSPVPLFSFYSISKGVICEGGRRGGYFECTNISDDILELIYKLMSVALCTPVCGQIGVDCMVRPPKEGEESYALWKKESDAIHSAFAQRTQIIAARLNQLEGVSCVNSPASIYLFPRIRLSKAAIEAAERAGKEPDVFYALELIDQTGICVVPGSGFGQVDGTWHYRLTCLCPGVEEYVNALETFHKGFVKKYGSP